MAETYVRKISDEEAQGRYILIVKAGMDFFPKAGKPFKLKVANKEFETFIEGVDVWSMGPKKPKQSYRIDAKPFWELFPLNFGKKITFTKESDKLYSLA
ncbi:MAG: hypothetical protein SCK70_04985 [bacterium]|nr:hypothetical protein [bacterium]